MAKMEFKFKRGGQWVDTAVPPVESVTRRPIV